MRAIEFFDISNNTANNGELPIIINASVLNIRNTNSRDCVIPKNTSILHAEHNRIKWVVVTALQNTVLNELYLSHNRIESANFLSEF